MACYRDSFTFYFSTNSIVVIVAVIVTDVEAVAVNLAVLVLEAVEVVTGSMNSSDISGKKNSGNLVYPYTLLYNSIPVSVKKWEFHYATNTFLHTHMRI
jgi:hypothetical protein